VLETLTWVLVGKALLEACVGNPYLGSSWEALARGRGRGESWSGITNVPLQRYLLLEGLGSFGWCHSVTGEGALVGRPLDSAPCP
jgi:hypothetical protein